MKFLGTFIDRDEEAESKLSAKAAMESPGRQDIG